MATFHTAQLDPYALSGAGAVAGATSIVLKSFQTIDGTNLAMTDFGTIGYGTLEPGNGDLEEQISFTGVVQNANGTATLTGVKTVLFLSPYTESSGLAKTHAGSTSFVISNTAGFYNQFPAKVNDETITGQWTFVNTPIVPGSVSDASTTIKGVSFLSTAAASATGPITVGTNDPRLQQPYYAATSVGTDAYAITLTSAAVPAAYAAGQQYTFLADVANTGAATLKVNSLAAITIKKNVSTDLATGDILAGQLVVVEYDGTNFQLINATPTPAPVVRTYNVADSPATWTKPANLQYIDVQAWGAGGGGARGVTATSSGGGGGGGYARQIIQLASLGATASITIGAGGAGATTNGGTGSSGANSTFGGLVTAYGGGGSGTNASGGGGGGGGGSSSIGVASTTSTGGSGGSPIAGAAPGGSSSFGGGGGGSTIGTQAGGQSAMGGGGGGGSGGAGGASWYGGGGGGAGGDSAAAGGVSTNGGSGGAGTDNGAGVTGTVPGGGGGGGENGNGGAGGGGRVIVTEYYT